MAEAQRTKIVTEAGTPAPDGEHFRFYENPAQDFLDGPQERHEHLSLPYGEVDLTSWQLEGVRLLYTRHHYAGHYRFLKQNSEDVVHLSFNLKGTYHIHHMGNLYPVQPGQHNMVYSPGTSNTFSNHDLQAETFSVQFQPDTFLRFTEVDNGLLGAFSHRVREGLPAVLAPDSLWLDSRLRKVIDEILFCAFSGPMQKIFLLSKSMEILVRQTDTFLQAASQQPERLKDSGERQRITQAGQYLLSRIQDPPNLSQLAREVGLNEYKLKKGFREVFSSTVFGYLITHRLELSRQMLLDTGSTAAEIAFELGFSSPQHFNHAFKKKYGLAPKQFVHASAGGRH